MSLETTGSIFNNYVCDIFINVIFIGRSVSVDTVNYHNITSPGLIRFPKFTQRTTYGGFLFSFRDVMFNI